MIHTKPIGLIAAFVLGLATMNPPTASCKPKGYKDQRQYAQVLNPLATSVMSWYGYLVTPKQQRSREVQDDVKKLFDTAEAPSSYQQRYPSRIRNIDILEAGLDRQGLHKFEFHIESRVFLLGIQSASNDSNS